MVDLPKGTSQQIVTSEAPRPAVSGADVAAPYEMLSHALDRVAGGMEKFGEGLGEVAKPLAERAGLEAVTRDAQGNLQVAKAPIIGEAGHLYERGVKYSALAQGEAEAQRQDLLLSKQFPNDPQGYLTASQAFRKKIVDEYNTKIGPEVGLSLGKAIDAKTTYNYRWLLLQQQHTIKENFEKDTRATINRKADEIESIIESGGADTPEGRKAIVAAHDDILQIAHERVHNPILSAAPAETAITLQQLDERFGAARSVAEVRKILNAPDGGPFKAQDFVEAQLQRKDISSTQAQLNYVHGLAEIKNWHNNNAQVQGIANQRQKQKDELIENQIIKDHASDKPEINEYDIKTNPDLSPESKMRMLAWVKRDGLPEPLSRVSQQTTMDLFRRMNLEDGDPSKITSLGPIRDAYAPSDGRAGRLKREDEEWLERRFIEGRTPEGSQISQVKAQVIKSSGLDRSSMMKADDTGKMAEYKYARYVEQRVDDYRKAGKTPAEIMSTLLNPNSKEFIGAPEVTHFFRSTMEEQTKNIQERFTGKNRPPPPPGLEGTTSATPAKRQPGESISDFDKRTGIK